MAPLAKVKSTRVHAVLVRTAVLVCETLALQTQMRLLANVPMDSLETSALARFRQRARATLARTANVTTQTMGTRASASQVLQELIVSLRR